MYLFDISEKNILSTSLIQCSDFIILGYDVTNEQSFEEVENYFKQIKENKNNKKTSFIYLLANKIDLQNKIKIQEDKGKSFADSKNIKFFSMSVKNDINAQNFINDLKSNIRNKFENDANNIKNRLLSKEALKKCYKVVVVG